MTAHKSSMNCDGILRVGVTAAGGSTTLAGTHYFDSAMLVVGFDPIVYASEDPAVGLMRCQRYYEEASPANTYWHFSASKSAGNVTYTYWRFQFKTTKSAVPAITITKTGVALLTNPTDGNTGLNVTGSATMVASEVNQEGWRLNMGYPVNQSTYNVMEFQGNWEAEVV